MYMMLNRVRNTLENIKNLSHEVPILIGVSGGHDSLSLLHILHQFNYLLTAAYFNHGLRPEAFDEVSKVKQIIGNLGIPFVSAEQDVGAFAEDRKLSIEEAARILRYRFLFRQAKAINAQAVAVGHNADDQVETVLMHLLRGTGLDGLRGMQTVMRTNNWSNEIALLRPLLSVWRSEINDYCDQHNLRPIIDRSNEDQTFFRNRLRHELIPMLEDYVPRASARIWRMAATLQGDHDIVMQVVDRAWDNCFEKQGEGYLALDEKMLQQQPLGVKRRLVRRSAELGLGMRLILEDGKFYIATLKADLPLISDPQLPELGSLRMPIPGQLHLSHRWLIVARFVLDGDHAKEQALINNDPFQTWISLDNRNQILTLRPRQPGDRFAPLGMQGHTTKVTDFMINQKIPRCARAAWPLICVDGEIAWVPGFRLGENFKLTTATNDVVHIKLTRDVVNNLKVDT